MTNTTGVSPSQAHVLHTTGTADSAAIEVDTAAVVRDVREPVDSRLQSLSGRPHGPSGRNTCEPARSPTSSIWDEFPLSGTHILPGWTRKIAHEKYQQNLPTRFADAPSNAADVDRSMQSLAINILLRLTGEFEFPIITLPSHRERFGALFWAVQLRSHMYPEDSPIRRRLAEFLGSDSDSKPFCDCAWTGDANAIRQAFEQEINAYYTHRHDELRQRAANAGIDVSQPGWLSDAMRQGSAPPGLTRQDINRQLSLEGFDLAGFVERHFKQPPSAVGTGDVGPSGTPASLNDYINAKLEENRGVATGPVDNDSMLELKGGWLKAGKRFSDLYNWDNYLHCQGLLASGREPEALELIQRMAESIRTYGVVYNGSRDYFSGRSQPEVFCSMVRAYAEVTGDESVYRTYLPEMMGEFRNMLVGLDAINPGETYYNVAMRRDGSVLLMYHDMRQGLREEGLLPDLELLRHLNGLGHPLTMAAVGAGERAGARDGQDMNDGQRDPITGVNILPTSAPLQENAHWIEMMDVLVHALAYCNRPQWSRDMAKLREQAIVAVRNTFIDPATGRAGSYCHLEANAGAGRLHPVNSAQAMNMLWAGIATPEQAEVIVNDTFLPHLLKRGGVAASDIDSGRQWDGDNQWAMNVMKSEIGLSRYGYTDLAELVALLYAINSMKTFEMTGGVWEKNLAEPPGLPKSDVISIVRQVKGDVFADWAEQILPAGDERKVVTHPLPRLRTDSNDHLDEGSNGRTTTRDDLSNLFIRNDGEYPNVEALSMSLCELLRLAGKYESVQSLLALSLNPDPQRLEALRRLTSRPVEQVG